MSSWASPPSRVKVEGTLMSTFLFCLHPGSLEGLVWRLAEKLHLPFLGEPRGCDGAGSWNIVT